MALEDLAGYSLRRGLGSGSVGAVWLVRNLASGRHAVLKRIPKTSIPAVEEFRGDLDLAQSIDHPHVARLLEVRQTETEWLLFSQYVAAGTLTALLQRRGPLSLGELVTLISPLAQGLAAMHRMGLTHGHLGIGDVMFDADGRPVVTDAGLRLQTDPSSAAADLAALGDLAREAAADSKLFTPALFTGDGDQIAQQILHLAPPDPINLGFGLDPTPTTPPTTSAPPATSTPPTSAPPPTTSEPPTKPPPTSPPTASFSPVGHDAGGEQAIHPPSNSSDASGAPGSAPSPAPAAATNSGPGSARSARRPFLGRRAAKSRTRRRGPGRAARSSSPRSSTPRAGVDRIGADRTGGRSAGSRGTGVGSALGGLTAALRRALHSRGSAYGLLAACGLAAVIVAAIGLATIGVLGQPATGSSTAADHQPNDSTLTPIPAAGSPSRTARTTPTSSAVSPSATAKQAAPDTIKWLRTLQTLDARRSLAFSTLDPADLDAIYVPGSSPWSSDRSLLATYRDQQLRVEGLRMQIETVIVEQPGDETVVLRIVDRLIAGAAVTPSGERTSLPPGPPTARRITLTATGSAWRIAAISKV